MAGPTALAKASTAGGALAQPDSKNNDPQQETAPEARSSKRVKSERKAKNTSGPSACRTHR